MASSMKRAMWSCDSHSSSDLIGFGSGIYGFRHHASLFELVERLPLKSGGRAFIFSTCGMPAFAMIREVAVKNHARLREKLRDKGYAILDEFSCVGWNTNIFLRFFGGINKGRPNAGDLRQAEEFARKLKRSLDSETTA